MQQLSAPKYESIGNGQRPAILICRPSRPAHASDRRLEDRSLHERRVSAKRRARQGLAPPLRPFLRGRVTPDA